MQRRGFAGAILPVNPNRATVQGLPAFASVDALPEAPDVAIVAVPGEAARAGGGRPGRARAAAPPSSSPPASPRWTRPAPRCRTAWWRRARAHGMRLLGPNCLGLFNAAINFYPIFSASFEQGWPIPGNIGIATQSGAYGTHIFAAAHAAASARRCCITTGNEADVSLGEAIGWMAQAPEVEVICAYAEGIRESARFIAALDLARRNRKPVVMMKVGRSAAGRRMRRSRTPPPSPATTRVTQAVLDEFGVVRARTTEQMLDIAYAATKRIYPVAQYAGRASPSAAGRAC